MHLSPNSSNRCWKNVTKKTREYINQVAVPIPNFAAVVATSNLINPENRLSYLSDHGPS